MIYQIFNETILFNASQENKKKLLFGLADIPAVSKVSKTVPIFLVHAACVACKRQLVNVHPKVLVTELDWDMHHLVDTLHPGGS